MVYNALLPRYNNTRSIGYFHLIKGQYNDCSRRDSKLFQHRSVKGFTSPDAVALGTSSSLLPVTQMISRSQAISLHSTASLDSCEYILMFALLKSSLSTRYVSFFRIFAMKKPPPYIILDVVLVAGWKRTVPFTSPSVIIES